MNTSFLENPTSLENLFSDSGKLILKKFTLDGIPCMDDLREDVKIFTGFSEYRKADVRINTLTATVTRLKNKLEELKQIELDYVPSKDFPEAIIDVKEKGRTWARPISVVKHDVSEKLGEAEHKLFDARIIRSHLYALLPCENECDHEYKTDRLVIRLYAECLGVKGSFIGKYIMPLKEAYDSVQRFNRFSAGKGFVSTKSEEYQNLKTSLVSLFKLFDNTDGSRKNLKKFFGENLNQKEIMWLVYHTFNTRVVRFTIDNTKAVNIALVEGSDWYRELAMSILYKLSGKRFVEIVRLPK